MPRRKSTQFSPLKRPLDGEFSYDSLGKKNKNYSDSTDSIESISASSRKDSGSTSPWNQPVNLESDAGIQKVDSKKSCPKGTKSASLPSIVHIPEDASDQQSGSEASGQGSSSSEKRNLSLEYLFQVTDSELQNMSREIPNSQNVTVANNAIRASTSQAATQLILAPVASHQPGEDNFMVQEVVKLPVSEKGVEKYQLKSDTLEQQGLKLVYTKQTYDQYEPNPVSYGAYKPQAFKSHQQVVDKIIQQAAGEVTVGRKRKHPQKPGRHICQYCGRGCAKPSVLQKHIRAHTGERPYPCEACGFSFKTKSNLYKHCKSRAHALKAGLSQNLGVSSEVGGTEGDGENDDVNEDSEDSLETLSDTDGQEEEEIKDSTLQQPETFLLAANEEKLSRESEDVAWVKKSSSLNDGLTDYGSAEHAFVDNVTCRIVAQTSKGQIAELRNFSAESTLQETLVQESKSKVLVPAVTAHTTVYLTDKHFYDVAPIPKHPSPKVSLTGWPREESLSHVSVSEVLHLTQQPNCDQATKALQSLETIQGKLASVANEELPLATSVQTLPDKSVQVTIQLPRVSTQGKENDMESKSLMLHSPAVTSSVLSRVTGAESKLLSSEMLRERIQQLISANAAIVDTPMAEPPRPKRIMRQNSEATISIQSVRMECSTQSTTLPSPRVSIPSISSVPLTPIPDDIEGRTNTDSYLHSSSIDKSEKPSADSIKPSPPHVEEAAVDITKTLIDAGFPDEKLPPSSVPSVTESIRPEIKIQIKLPKVSTMSVVPPSVVSQSMIGQPSVQFPLTSTQKCSLAACLKTTEGSVIKGLLLKEKAQSLNLPSTCHEGATLEKSYSSDSALKMEPTPTLVKDTHTSYLCSNCNILFKEERTFQMHQLYNCKRTETDFLFSSTPTRESKLNLSNPSRLGSIQKDIIATYLSQNQVLGNLANKPCSAELENIEKSFEEKSSLPAVAENPDSSTQKKKGRPKGTKNKLKDYAEPPSTTAPIHVLSCMSPSLSVPQTPILLATLQKKPILLPQGTLLASPVASASMIGQPMVSVQSPWSQPNTSTHSPVSVSVTPQTPQTPTSEVPTTQSLWKLKLKGKLLMKRSMSVERMLSREKESEASSPLGPLGTISSVAPVADGLGLGPKTIPLDGSKLADDNIERNDRNSPLKKRKVPSEFLQLDPVLRPGVTRAGSEPLMTSLSHRHRDLSLPNVSEISKSSLTEIYNLSQAGNNANSVGTPGSCREPVTVPVAQPLALPTQFGTPIQSFLCSFGIGVRQQMGMMPFSIPHGLSSLPAIIANSSLITTETDVLQLPLVTSLVVSQSQKVGKSGQMQILKQLNSPSKTDKTGTSSSVITQPLNRLMNSKPAPDKNLTPLYLYRHSYPSLQSLTHVTFCCVQPLQPMYVPQGGNAKISMYSNWRVSPHNRNPVGLTSRALFSLYNSRYTSNPVYISANSTPPREGIFTHSSYWNYYSSKPKIPVSTSSHDKQAEGLWQAATSAANTTTKVVKLPTDTRVSAEEKDVSQAVVAPADSESTQAMPRLKEFFSGKEPKRVRIFKGGFKSNEEYVYVKGRGRGKYVCEKCGIRCKKPSMLKKHIRTHTDLRPYHCRHCRFSFKTKGNLTKHMKSKAHQKKCLELGVNPVPVTVDDSQIDNEALAAQCAIAKDTKILEDENEMDDDEDDEDMDEEEETDDAEEGQYSDSEDSERKIAISYEKMDTAESTVEKGSEADPSVRPVFANTSPTECPQAHPAKSRAVSLELIPAKGSSGPLPSSRVASVPDVHATPTTSPTRQTAHQLQIDKEIAKSLLDLSKHPEHRMENLDRTTVTESSRRGSLLLRQNSIDFGLSGPPGLTGKEDQESSGSQALPPAHDANESRVAEIPAEKEGRRDEFVLNKLAAPLLLEKLGMQIGISHLNRSIASTPSSFGTVSVGSQKSSIMADSVKETPKPTEERNLQTILSFPVPPAKASLPPSSSPPQSHPSGLMSSCYHGPIIGQLIRRESINVQSVSSNVSSQLGVATTSFATPFQFSHPFQAFERTSNMAGEQEDLTLTMARDNKLATENDVVIIGTSTTISSDRREMLNSAVVNSHDIMSTIGKVPGDETLQVVLSRVGSLPLSNRLGKSGELDAGKSTQTTSPILQKMHRVVIPSQQYRVSSYEGWHAAGEPTPGTADAVLNESNTDGQYKCNVCFKKICEHQQHLLCQQESFSEESGCFCCDVCNLTFRSELQKMEHLLSDPPHSQVVAKDPVRMAAEDVQASHDCQGCKCSFWKKSRLMKRGESSSQGTALHNFQKFSADVHPQAERKSPADWEKHPETTHLRIGFRQGVEEALDLSVEDTAVAATGEEESDEGELMIDENDVEQDMDVTSPDSADRSLKEHFHVHQKAAYERNKEASNERVTVEIKQEPIDIGEIGHGKARSSKWYAVDSDSEKYGNMEADALASNVYANNVSVPMGLMEKAHKCGICRKAYQTLEQLKTHLIAHAELRPYVCEYCDAGFTNAQSLKTHLQTHRQEKPYVCGNCGDTFARSEDLKRHLHIHSAHMQVLRYSLDETFQKRRRADPDSPSALRGGAALRLWRSADSAGKSALDNPGNFQAGQSPAKSSVGHRGTGLSQPTKDSLHFHTDSPSTSKRTSGHITSAFNE